MATIRSRAAFGTLSTGESTSDLVHRLRERAVWAVTMAHLLHEAADTIEQLTERSTQDEWSDHPPRSRGR